MMNVTIIVMKNDDKSKHDNKTNKQNNDNNDQNNDNDDKDKDNDIDNAISLRILKEIITMIIVIK